MSNNSSAEKSTKRSSKNSSKNSSIATTDAVWDDVLAHVESHDYMGGVERTVERVAATGEVFTPSVLVVEMLKQMPESDFGPGKTVLDPACGDGQFLVAVKWVKVLIHGMTEEDALADIYGVDIMRDNVDLCKLRLGGGTILMGDTMRPPHRLEDQTEEEWDQMQLLFPHTARTHRHKK
jgi:type I restriction-modification system DNA methylase subunit